MSEFKKVNFLKLFILCSLFFQILPSEVCSEAIITSFESLKISQELAEKIIATLPSKPKNIDILSGFTNSNYLITCESGEKFILRVFNSKYHSNTRQFECKNQNFAHEIGIAPKMTRVADSIAIISFIPSSRPLSINKDTLPKFAHTIAKLHYSSLYFDNGFDFIDEIKKLLQRCVESQCINLADEFFIKKALEKYKLNCERLKILYTPCHNDLHLDNFIITQDAVKIIDWEDSGKNDPAWDVAYFLLTSFVPENLWSLFFESYLAHLPRKDETFIERVNFYSPYVLIDVALSIKVRLIDQKISSIEGESLVNQCLDGAKALLNNNENPLFIQAK